MNVPQLRFDGFEREWTKTNLGHVTSKVQDGNYGAKYPKNDEFLESGIPFLTGKVLGKTGYINKKLIDYISVEKHRELNKAHIKENDILFTNRGASVGAIGFVDESIKEGNIGPQLTLIRADNSKILSELLFQIIKAPVVQRQISENDSGSAMKFFGIENTKKFKLSYPREVKEQMKIASFFTLIE